jgi:predicted nucleotidyltransferase
MGVGPDELARTLVQRHAAERRRAKSRGEALREELQGMVREEIAAGRIDRAWLVGSLAWGGFDLSSDVDVVVEGLAADDSTALWDRLCTALGTRVDLLRLEGLTSAFAHRVRSEGEPLHVP